MVMEDGKAAISRKMTFHLVPCKLDANWAHLTEWAFDHKTFLALVLNMAKLPLYLMLVTHVVEVVDAVLWCLEVAWVAREVIKLLFFSHLFHFPVHLFLIRHLRLLIFF